MVSSNASPCRPTTAPAVAVLVIATLVAVLLPGRAEAARDRTALELEIEQAVLRLHDSARAAPDAFYPGTEQPPAPALTVWSDIRSVARGWSDQMAAEGRMSHNPDYGEQYGQWSAAAENVGRVSGSSLDADAVALQLVSTWMASSGHRRNIMNPAFDEFGVGISIVGDTVWATVDFRAYDGSPRPSSASSIDPITTAAADGSTRELGTPMARSTDAACEGAGTSPFVDVGPEDIHGTMIACLHHRQVVSGVTAVTYDPAGIVTRGQLATLLVTALDRAGHALPATDRDRFTDDDGHIHEEAIDVLAASGVIEMSGASIDPGARVSRAEMARWTLDALGAAGIPISVELPDYFTDDDGHPDEASIDGLAYLGVLTGRGDGTYAPDGRLRRDHMATFLTRTIAAVEGR